jgi:hypothetical protein
MTKKKTSDPAKAIADHQREMVIADWERSAVALAREALNDGALTKQQRAQDALTILSHAAGRVARFAPAGGRA